MKENHISGEKIVLPFISKKTSRIIFKIQQYNLSKSKDFFLGIILDG